MSQFPQALKTWRKARKFSQLDLATEADVSLRHVSFLETGRARPSPDMIGKLGDALHLPLDARNQLLTHAGYAVRYAARDWRAEEMAPVRAAITYTLSQHAPYPALALDRLWTVVEMNEPAAKIYGILGVKEQDSLLDLMMSPALPSVIENWPEVAHHAAQRLRVESAAQGGITALDRTADYLGKVKPPKDAQLGPMVPTILRAGPLRLSLFASIAQFGTPEDVTLDDLKIELYFPADADTKQALETL